MRELGPTLTAVIVGGRIGSGMAAEVGAMNVTEQVDAIRALGGDPAKKLVLPRVVAAMIVMPLLSIFADALGTLGALLVCDLEYQIKPLLFIQSALESVQLSDLISGLAKTPVFGFIIAIVGCHFGLTTRGGTEGVGQSTTRTVVVVSISILVADYFLTRIRGLPPTGVIHLRSRLDFGATSSRPKLRVDLVANRGATTTYGSQPVGEVSVETLSASTLPATATPQSS